MAFHFSRGLQVNFPPKWWTRALAIKSPKFGKFVENKIMSALARVATFIRPFSIVKIKLNTTMKNLFIIRMGSLCSWRKIDERKAMESAQNCHSFGRKNRLCVDCVREDKIALVMVSFRDLWWRKQSIGWKSKDFKTKKKKVSLNIATWDPMNLI